MSVCLSINLSVCLSVCFVCYCLSINLFCLSVCLSIDLFCLSVYQSVLSVTVCLSICFVCYCLSINLSVYLSICFVCLSVCLSICFVCYCLSVCLSINLSINLYLHFVHVLCVYFQVEALDSGKLDTLFRGNTIACKVLSIAFKTFGLYYLQSVLRPLILNLMKTQEYDYEVDPMRLPDPSKLQSNQTRLLEVVKSFYKTILNSLPSLPLQLRTVCHILYQVIRYS